MPRGPVQGPGTTPGGGQVGRPGIAGGTTGTKSPEQRAPDRDQAADAKTGGNPKGGSSTPGGSAL
jgi:hypothetical protein